MLSRAEKGQIIEGLRSDIEKANAMVLTNLIGVSANDSVSIRKSVREAGGKIVITRNTLFKKAAEGTICEDLVKDLKGPHALALSFDDAAAVAKTIYDAGKEHEDVVKLIGGTLRDKVLSLDELKELATLPSRDQMLATLLATFNAPVSAFVRVLHAINEQKGGGDTIEAASES